MSWTHSGPSVAVLAVVVSAKASEPDSGSLMPWAADERPVAEPRQVPLLLFVGPKMQERHLGGPHLGVQGEDQAVVAAAVAQASSAMTVVSASAPPPPYSFGTGSP